MYTAIPDTCKSIFVTYDNLQHDASLDRRLCLDRQVRVMNRARLHPALAPYWARAIVKMMLIPSQVQVLGYSKRGLRQSAARYDIV